MLKVEHSDGAMIVTLDRPQARNALNLEMTRSLTAQLAVFDRDASARVLVLTGSDPAFCAGLDLKDFAAANSPRNEVSALLAEFPRRRKPVIGAINGAAVTGGLELALGCDFLIASERARFADTHSKIGALAGGGMGSVLPHAIGYRWAKQMSFTCAAIDAGTALRIGLVNEVVAHDVLLQRALELARAIAQWDSELIGTVKNVLDRGARTTLEESQRIETAALASRKSQGSMQWKP